MLITTLKSKIAYAKVTEQELYYVGSVTIDPELMKEANIVANERVQIVNLNNGQRFETYVIPGKPGSQTFGINGPAARKVLIGDLIFILSYALIDPDKETLEPVVIHMEHPEK